MELSTIKNTVNSFAHSTADRVKGNWNNLSTPGKVAAVASSILLVGAGVAAQFLGAGLLSLTTVLTVGVSHLIAHIAGAALTALGLAVPACLLLKKEQQQPKAIVVKEEVVVEQTTTVQETPQEVAQTSRLINLKNASLQFVKNHPRLVIAGSVLAIGVLSAGLMGSQRRNLIASMGEHAANTAFTASKDLGNKAIAASKDLGNKAIEKGRTVATNSREAVQAGFVRAQSKLGFAKK